MKLKNFLLFLVVSIFVSLVGNLYTNMKINEVSKNLTILNKDIVELQIIKDQTFNLYQEQFSIQNIEKISALLNYKKLDVFIVNKNLSSPYKLNSELVQIDILGSLSK
ncbi:MAG: hypothetical protein CL493_01960 [Actinobacteria bacterium]|nr:hypothetical protein [Actinomycetota bacterium]